MNSRLFSIVISLLLTWSARAAGGTALTLNEVNLPIYRLNPPMQMPPGFPPLIARANAGQYTGTVAVEKTLAGLSQKYTLRAQASVNAEGKITILTTAQQGPGSVSAGGVEPAISVDSVEATEEGNCVIDAMFTGRFHPTRAGFKLEYTVTPEEAQAATVPTVTFKFTFKKQP